MQRRWNVFPSLTTTLKIICKPCLEKPSKDLNKIFELFARIPRTSYFAKYLKIWCQWFQGKHLSCGSISTNLVVVSQRLFQNDFCKNTPPRFLFLFFGFWRIFSELTKTSNSWWISQKILYKKVKRVLQRSGGGTRVAMELQKINKVSHYKNSTADIFTIFWVSFV